MQTRTLVVSSILALFASSVSAYTADQAATLVKLKNNPALTQCLTQNVKATKGKLDAQSIGNCCSDNNVDFTYLRVAAESTGSPAIFKGSSTTGYSDCGYYEDGSGWRYLVYIKVPPPPANCNVNINDFVSLLNKNRTKKLSYKSGLDACAKDAQSCYNNFDTVNKAIGTNARSAGNAYGFSIATADDANNRLASSIESNAKYIGGSCIGTDYYIFWAY